MLEQTKNKHHLLSNFNKNNIKSDCYLILVYQQMHQFWQNTTSGFKNTSCCHLQTFISDCLWQAPL